MRLDEEAARATELLVGKIVKRVVRHRHDEVLIGFEDGSLLFAHADGQPERWIEVHDGAEESGAGASISEAGRRS